MHWRTCCKTRDLSFSSTEVTKTSSTSRVPGARVILEKVCHTSSAIWFAIWYRLYHEKRTVTVRIGWEYLDVQLALTNGWVKLRVGIRGCRRAKLRPQIISSPSNKLKGSLKLRKERFEYRTYHSGIMCFDNRHRKCVQTWHNSSCNAIGEGRTEAFIRSVNHEFNIKQGRFPQDDPHPLLCNKKVCLL